MSAESEARQVNLELNRKLRLEAQFTPKVDAMFNRMLKAHSESVRETGLPLNAAQWESNWAKLLEAHYQDVQVSFSGVVKRSQKSMYAIEIKQDGNGDEEAVAAALLLWRSGQSNSQANHITDTSIRNVSNAMSTARQALLEEGEDLSNRNMALASAAILRRSFKGRTGSIVMTETQSAAESTKLIEGVSLLGLEPETAVTGTIPAVTATKKWKTVGDNRVRLNHRIANNQIRPINRPYDVGGEQLMYPGDTRLGALPKNTANCRCSSLLRL